MTQLAHQRSVDFRFAVLDGAKRIWSVPAVHGDLKRLQQLHDDLLPKFLPGDRLVYMGNYIGLAGDSAGVVDELLTFRRMLLSISGVRPADIVYLRGQQEEMLQRVLKLQFASSPWSVYEWMVDKGLGATLESYGVDLREGLSAAASDAQSPGRLSRWTGFVRHMINRRPGHEIFYNQLKRAAYTRQSANDTSTKAKTPLLFVNTGLKTDLRLEDQGDRFWWGGDDFNTITDAYRPYNRVVRGYDPLHRGMHINCVTATVDNGCGYGGSLACALWNEDASVGEIFER